MKVLVTDGNTRAALAITRALGRENCEVIVGAEKHQRWQGKALTRGEGKLRKG